MEPPKSPEVSKSPSLHSRSASPNSQHSQILHHPANSPPLPPRAQPQGPRSPEASRTAILNPRDQPGSSRTNYYGVRSAHPTRPVAPIQDLDEPPDIYDPIPAIDSDTMTADMNTPHAPYRPPEAVIEAPEELPPGHVAGIIAEHLISDDEMPLNSSLFASKPSPDAWQANLQKYGMMDLDDAGVPPERPQVGPGLLPRRWLQLAHKHDIFQPIISDLPATPSRKSHTQFASMSDSPLSQTTKPTDAGSISTSPSSMPRSVTSASLADYEHISTIDDVWNACPGGKALHQEWYFCPSCWGWLRIVAGRGDLPPLATMEEWEEIDRVKGSFDAADRRRHERLREWSRFNDLKTSRMMAQDWHHHLHEFTSLLEPSEQTRIDRIPVDDDINAFPHMTAGIEPEDASWTTFTLPSDPPRLYVSCSSDLWMLVDTGPVPGQLPVGLVNAFVTEKMTNPGPSMDGRQSVSDAWTLVATSVDSLSA